MADCKGEACKVTEYTFEWGKVKVTSATGSFAGGSPPKTTGADITKQVQEKDKTQTQNGNDNGFTKDAVSKKAEAAKGSNPPHKIVKREGGKFTFVDQSCGPEGGCICSKLDGAKGQKVEAMEMTFTIKGLTQGARQLLHEKGGMPVFHHNDRSESGSGVL